MMADLSDAPSDLVLYYRVLQQGYDCAFGTRFGNGGNTYSYPRIKLVLNRIANAGIRILFQHGYNDTTNAFKAYRRHVIDQIQPLLSNHFNLTVEMPLKAVIRGYTYAVVPVTWTNRQHGESKLKIKEMGSRYAFIILYTWLEHHLSRGDYRRTDIPSRQRPAQTTERVASERHESRAHSYPPR
jgi:dolichol-phosphate mannosyltransferase